MLLQCTAVNTHGACTGVGMAFVPILAPADRLVRPPIGLHRADGIGATGFGVVDEAGVRADAVEACLVLRAVGVHLAAQNRLGHG